MTKEKFDTFVDIQERKITNMFHPTAVQIHAGGKLTREDCVDIIGNYEKYEKEYN